MISRSQRIAAAAAGPVLIVGSTFLVLRDYVFGGLIYVADVLTLWLPTYCFLGRSLADGHIPSWNPHVMAGIPFAADPQSGWMNLPAMALFSTLPCGFAIRGYLLLQPILGGLSLYAFLRTEGAGRPASTVGGLVLGVGIAGSALAIALPFSATLAWIAAMLAAAAWFVRAPTWTRRLLWALLVAVAWGQVVAAFPSEGVITGTVALIAYALASSLRNGGRAAMAAWGMLALALVPVNLAYFLPRLAYFSRTTLSVGYDRLDELNTILSGRQGIPSTYRGASPAWPLNLSLSPGLYLGAAALILAIAAVWSRRHRHLVVGFSLFGLLFYIVSLERVANEIATWFGLADLLGLYLHAPARLGLALPIAIAILGGLGLQTWHEARTSRLRVLMLGPGFALWAAAPLFLGARPGSLALLGLGAALAIVALVSARRRPWLAALVPVVLAAELVLNGALSAPLVGGSSADRSGFRPRPPHMASLPDPMASIDLYLSGGPIGLSLGATRHDRYLTTGTQAQQERAQDDGYGILNQAMVFGIENAGGYNSVQLLRYWTFVRASQREPIQYNRALFLEAPPIALDLLQVRHVLAPADVAAPPGAREVIPQDGWILFERPTPPPRVSVVPTWTVVEGPDEALRTVLDPGFDPEREVVLEGNPPVIRSEHGPAGEQAATYEPLGLQAARIRVETSGPAMVLIRSSFDPHWHARLDGRPAEILVADSFLQAVPVPAGRHTIDLAYDDPWVGYGLLGSALAWGGLLAAAALAARRGRKDGLRPLEHEEAPGVGLEPTTLGLTGPRSAD